MSEKDINVGENCEGVLPGVYLDTAFSDIREALGSFEPGTEKRNKKLFGEKKLPDKKETTPNQ